MARNFYAIREQAIGNGQIDRQLMAFPTSYYRSVYLVNVNPDLQIINSSAAKKIKLAGNRGFVVSHGLGINFYVESIES